VAQAELIRAKTARIAASRRRRRRWLVLVFALAVFAAANLAYLADIRGHQPLLLLSWFDLSVYNHGGLLALHSPATLYSWQLMPGIKFTYTPFAALLFAGTSTLPWTVLTTLVTITSVIAVPLTGWLTFGALGWRGMRRLSAALALAAVALWTEPVQRALHLGQVELLLMLLIVWDLCQGDNRRWKGAGIGLAAGIKLVPLIFIPYLLLAGKLRQAAVATASFVVTTVIGFIFLPKDSASYWFTGYFLHPRNTGSVGALVNQSMLGFLTRLVGTESAARPVWEISCVIIAVLGLAAAAVLHRSGRPVEGWVACALTGLLVSPISWDHHWVWILPILAVLVDLGVRARGALRWGAWALMAGLAGLFGAWPVRWSGTWAFVPVGLLGFFVDPFSQYRLSAPSAPVVYHKPGVFHQLIDGYLRAIKIQRVYNLQGSQVLGKNLYVLAGLALFVLVLVAALRAGPWRARRAASSAGPRDSLARPVLDDVVLDDVVLDDVALTGGEP